jgi:hypothetical protein
MKVDIRQGEKRKIPFTTTLKINLHKPSSTFISPLGPHFHKIPRRFIQTHHQIQVFRQMLPKNLPDDQANILR